MQAVIFDLFETLITEENRPKMYGDQLMQQLGGYSAQLQAHWDALWLPRWRGEYPDTQSVLRTIYRQEGIVVDDARLSQLSLQRDQYKRNAVQQVAPDILDMLSALKHAGYQIGLISNCSPEEVSEFSKNPIRPYLDVCVFSCDVGYVKPEVEIYQICASRLQLPCTRCLFIGDGGSQELSGARQTDMYCAQAGWYQTMPQSGDAFACIPTPAEVPAYAAKLFPKP